MYDDNRTDGHVGHHRAAVVNGPEGDDLGWGSVDWARVEGDVGRLRQRIFTASQAGDLAKVRSLQKLMLRSRANALLSVPSPPVKSSRTFPSTSVTVAPLA